MKRIIEDLYVIRRGFGTVAAEFGLTVDNCPTNRAFLQVNRLLKVREQGYCSMR